MSSRLAFQTQLASIMEVLANAAVAEICKLVDDDYAVVRLQMSQCQRENKALKRKLHLLELKMARGNAERRLRESALNSSRPRVHVSADDRLREPPSAGGVYDLWPSRAPAQHAASQPIRSDSVHSKSPDVELVEPKAVLVKEEKMEANMSRAEEAEKDVELIGDDGVLACVPRGLSGQRGSNEQQDNQSQTGRTRHPSNRSSRGVEREEEPDVVLVKVEEMDSVRATQSETGLSIQEGLVESSTDDYKGMLPFEESTHTSSSQQRDLQDPSRAFSEPVAVVSEDSSVPVQLRVPDSNGPASPSNPLASEYSLLELETFFTRWAPDASGAGGPSCSFSTNGSAKCQKDGAVAETEQPASATPNVAPGPCLSSAARRSTALSKPLRTQAPSVQCPWRPAQARTGAPCQRDQSTPPSQSAAASGISLACRKTSSGGAPPARGAGAALASFEVALNAQHGAALLAQHRPHAVSTVPNERRRKSYACRACGKAFSGLSNLEAHERVHTGEKPFRCDTCGKHFSEAGNLKKHQRVHTGEKPFSCDQCGKRFAWICNLRTHQQSATGCVAAAGGGSGLG